MKNNVNPYYTFSVRYIRQLFHERTFFKFFSPLVLIIPSVDLEYFAKEVSKYTQLEGQCNLIACRVYESFAFFAPKIKELYHMVELYYVYKSKTLYIFVYKLIMKLYFFFSYFIIYFHLLPLFYTYITLHKRPMGILTEPQDTLTRPEHKQ